LSAETPKDDSSSEEEDKEDTIQSLSVSFVSLPFICTFVIFVCDFRDFLSFVFRQQRKRKRRDSNESRVIPLAGKDAVSEVKKSKRMSIVSLFSTPIKPVLRIAARQVKITCCMHSIRLREAKMHYFLFLY